MKSNLLIVLSLAAGALTLNSCKKSSETTTSNIYITANVNGTATTFNTNAIAISVTSNGQTITNIEGTAKDGSMVAIEVAGTITSGKVYSDANTDPNDSPLLAYTPGGANADTYLNDDDNTSTLPTVTVTSITANSISGTFSGLVEGGIPIGNTNNLPTKLFTNGKFNVSYTKKSN
jgi:hypothetical protein